MIYAWKVIGWIDGHPAGHVGTYRTREDADVAARRTWVTTRIKRVRVPDDYFDPPTDDDDAEDLARLQYDSYAEEKYGGR